MENRPIADVKKKGETEGRKIVFEDESTFQLLPSVQRTYSRKGQRPTIETEVITQKCVRVAVAISADGDLDYEVRECSFKSAAMVRFLKNLQQAWRKRRKKILLIWDGASIHTSSAVKDWLVQQADRATIWLERIPPYSPQLNPAEQVWNYLKNVLLANICCKTVKELKNKVIEALETIKEDKDLIQLFFYHKTTGFYN